MTRAGIAKPVVLGCTYRKARRGGRFENKFMYGGLRNPCMPFEFLKYNNIMLIQRRRLCESFRANAGYFDDRAEEAESEAAYEYYRIRSQLLKECAWRMSESKSDRFCVW